MYYGHQIEALAIWIPLSQTWVIVETICEVISPIMTTCVIYQCRGYWLLSDALASTIKLYVKLSKERLELQVEIDAIEEMDMHMKMKQLGANMQRQVTIIFRLSLISCFFSNPLNLTTWLLLCWILDSRI